MTAVLRKHIEDEESDGNADGCAYEHIAEVMYAEIDARVCHAKRECEERKAYPHSSRHQRYEGCHAERVGRMTGTEAVLTASISVDVMEQILHARRMRRTKTCEVRLHDVGRQLVAERHGQSYGQDYQQALSVLRIRLEEKIKEQQGYRHPQQAGR